MVLYDRESNVSSMEPFMQRFKTRIKEMALFEVDQATRIQAITLCISLSENSILEPTECAELGTLLFSDLPKVRNAITPLIHLTLQNDFVTPKMDEAKAKAATLPPVRSTGGRTRGITQEQEIDKHAIQFKCLATILLEYSKASQVVKKPNDQAETSDPDSVNNDMELDTRSDTIQQSSDKLNIDPRFGSASYHEQSRIAQAITCLVPEIPVLRVRQYFALLYSNMFVT
jgi:cohesin complex subunit SA-1/2